MSLIKKLEESSRDFFEWLTPRLRVGCNKISQD